MTTTSATATRVTTMDCYDDDEHMDVSLTTQVPLGRFDEHRSNHNDDEEDCFDRPILVGYAFGPKKMSTMTVVMAEASKSMMSTKQGGTTTTTTANCDDDNEDNDDDEDNEAMEDDYNHEQQVEDDNDEELGAAVQCHDEEEEERPMLQLREGKIPNDDSTTTKLSQQQQQQSVIVHDDDYNMNSTVGGCDRNYGDVWFEKAVGYYRSSCSSSVAASETAGSTTTTHGSTTTVTNTTSSSLQHFNPFGFRRSRMIRVSFVPLDLDMPLEEQHGGNMDIILHKLTEDILWVSQCSKRYDGHSSSTSTTLHSLEMSSSLPLNCISEQQQRIQRLLQYQRDHPNCSLVDDPTRIQLVMNRADIALLLQKHLVDVSSTSGWAVRSPQYLVVSQEELQYLDQQQRPCTSHADDDNNNNHVVWTQRLQNANIHFPIIVKPLTAAGTKTSHSMAILLQPSGLQQFLNKVVQPNCNTIPPTPTTTNDDNDPVNKSDDAAATGGGGGGYLFQEYVNHNAVLYKVYVLGPHVRVYPRPSLPNLPCVGGGGNDNNSNDDDDHVVLHPKNAMLEFDSQRPYPQLCDFFEFAPTTSRMSSSNNAAAAAAAPAITNRMIASSTMQPPPLPHKITVEEVQPIVHALKRAFGLELFGFDILVTTKANKTTTTTATPSTTSTDPTTEADSSNKNNVDQPELWVVDVNYFPSYKEVSNFSSLLAQYLTQRAIQGRQRRRRRQSNQQEQEPQQPEKVSPEFQFESRIPNMATNT